MLWNLQIRTHGFFAESLGPRPLCVGPGWLWLFTSSLLTPGGQSRNLFHPYMCALYHLASAVPFSWRRQWHPTPVLLPGKSHGRRSLVGYSPWGRQESDTTKWLHFHFSPHALEKEMATHSSVLAWRIPGTGEPAGLPSVGWHRVGHDWSNLAAGSFCIQIVSFKYQMKCCYVQGTVLGYAREWMNKIFLLPTGNSDLKYRKEIKPQNTLKI